MDTMKSYTMYMSIHSMLGETHNHTHALTRHVFSSQEGAHFVIPFACYFTHSLIRLGKLKLYSTNAQQTDHATTLTIGNLKMELYILHIFMGAHTQI